MNVAGQPAVVLLHSSGSSARQWQPLVEALRRDFRVLCVDFHGHGPRPDWDGIAPMRLADDAALAVPLLERVGGAHVVGHSYGAAVAVKIATSHPQLVHSLTGYEPVLFQLLRDDAGSRRDWHEVQAAVETMRDRVERAQLDTAARIFVEFWSGRGSWEALPPHRQQGVADRMPSVMRHFSAVFAEPSEREQLPRSGIPMLFLAGARTVPAARRIGHLLRVLLPLADHLELPGMGHMGPLTHPARVNHRIQQFLHAQALARTPDSPARRAALEDFLNRTFP